MYVSVFNMQKQWCKNNDAKTGNLQEMVLMIKATIELDIRQNTIKKNQHVWCWVVRKKQLNWHLNLIQYFEWTNRIIVITYIIIGY